MAMDSSVRNRLDETLARADAVMRRRVEADETAFEAEQVEKARANSFKRQEIAERYDDAFQSFSERVPMAAADERPSAYRRRLYEILRRKLPPSDEWATTRSDDLTFSAMNAIEPLVIAAAKREGMSPSVANLPDDREIVRTRVNPESGARETHFFAKESFIKGLGRPGRVVERI